MTTSPLRPIRALLRAAWAIFNQHFPILFGITAIGTVPQLLLNTSTGSPEEFNGTVAAAGFLGFLLVIFLSVWMTASIYYFLVKKPATKNPFNIYGQAVGYVRRFFTTGMLQGLIIFGIGLVAFIPTVLLFGLNLSSIFASREDLISTDHLVTLITAAVVAGIIVLVPVLYLTIRWQFSPLMIITTDSKNWSAMQRSAQLVRGRWWTVFARLLGLGLICLAVIIAVQIVAAPMGNSNLANAIESVITSLLIGPFIICYEIEVFSDLRGSTTSLQPT